MCFPWYSIGTDQAKDGKELLQACVEEHYADWICRRMNMATKMFDLKAQYSV